MRFAARSTIHGFTWAAKARFRRFISASTSRSATERRFTPSLPGSSRRNNADVTVRRPTGHAFGYWHIRPVVREGQHVRLHQLLGYVLPGWGHVHFAESYLG